MAKQKSSEPQMRLPEHRAPFYFAPQFLPTAAEWHLVFGTLVSSIDTSAKINEADQWPWALSISFGNFKLTIDARRGTFDVSEQITEVDDDNAGWAGFEDVPSSFVDRLRSVRMPNPAQGRALRRILVFAEELVEKMSIRFSRALKEGQALTVAQIGSPTPDREFLQITVQQRRYFRIESKVRDLSIADDDDNELDEATGPNGEKLYSWCVIPRSSAPGLPVDASEPKLKPGRPGTVDLDRLHAVMLGLFRDKGIPKKGDKRWNETTVVRAVMNQIGASSPGKTTIRDNIDPVIRMLRKERASSHNLKSANSEIRQNIRNVGRQA